MTKQLIIVSGPTAVPNDVAIWLADQFGTEIINADSSRYTVNGHWWQCPQPNNGAY
jgi:hypothetical protein